jgi:hypothetical protein
MGSPQRELRKMTVGHDDAVAALQQVGSPPPAGFNMVDLIE